MLHVSSQQPVGPYRAQFGMWLLVLHVSLPAAAAEHSHVEYVTCDSLFLAAGSADGLLVGDTLVLHQDSQPNVICHVLSVIKHAARCSGVPGLRQATFVLPRARPRVAKTKLPTAGLAPGIIQRFRAALAALPVQRVVYHPKGVRKLGARTRAAWASLSHDNWLTLGGDGRTLQAERLDLGIVGAQIFAEKSWQASVRLTALAWSAQDTRVRFRDGTPVQVYVWQAQVDNTRPQQGPFMAAGRILPAYVPGVAVLDGAQMGWELQQHNTEIGGYAGFLPNPVTLAPSSQRWTVGMYSKMARRLAPNSAVQNNARLAFVGLPSGQSRFELETLTDVHVGSAFHAGFSPRFGVITDSGIVLLEAARLDAAANWHQWVNLYTGARFSTGDVDVVDGIIEGVVGYPTALRTTVTSQSALTVTPFASLSVAAENAIAWDKATGTLHVLTGPELSLPRLFGQIGGVSVAYMQETGTKPARSAFAQGQFHLNKSMSLMLRASYFEDLFQTDNLLREVSFYAGYRAELRRWLSLDLSALTRHGLHNSRYAADAPYSLRTSIRLTGQF